MSNLKYLAKLIVNIKAIRTFIIFLLRRNLIFKKFKNLIKLDGLKNIYKYQIEIFNDEKDAVKSLKKLGECIRFWELNLYEFKDKYGRTFDESIMTNWPIKQYGNKFQILRKIL